MDFDGLLEYFDSEAGQKEQVALVFFHLEEFEQQNNVAQSDVKEVIRRSRSTIKPPSVSEYFRRLDDDRWITQTENSGYRLSNDGRRGVKALLADGALDAPRNQDDRFIDSDVFEDHQFQKLVGDINKSYRYHIYDGTLVLTRKFFENMVFELLRDEYSGKDTQMFFDQENQRHYSFDELLNNFKIGVPDLQRFTKEGLDREMVEDIRDLKDMGNKGAHSIRVDFEEGEVEGISDGATHMAEVVYEVWQGAKNANSTSN